MVVLFEVPSSALFEAFIANKCIRILFGDQLNCANAVDA
jgi:hypothetical protein